METRGTTDTREVWLVPPRPAGGESARVSIERTLALMEARIDEALTLARGSSDVWEAAEAGMERIGQVALLASEGAMEAAAAAQEALARAAVAESHAERSAAAATASAMKAERMAAQAAGATRPAPGDRLGAAARPTRVRPVLRRAPRAAARGAAGAAGRVAGGDPLSRFSERADRLVARLHELERHPAAGSGDGPG